MKIDYKATVWFTIDINDVESLPKILERLNSGDSINDLYDHEDINISGSECVLETEEFLPPQENDNQSTIEVYDIDGKLVWDNSIESQVNRLQ
jgi:hypothetical protein